MTDRELMQQALGLLASMYDDAELMVTQQQHRAMKATITSLRERLARQEPASTRERWNIERDGNDLLVCFNGHEKHEGCRYERFVPARQEQEQEPVAFIHRQGNHWEVSERFLTDDEKERGWTEEPLYTAPPAREWPEKLWLWRNHVDGRPEYWAFDNPYPRNLDNGDPQTLGQPCGYALFKPSRDGSAGRTEEQVLREMKSVAARQWVGLTEDEAFACRGRDYFETYRAIEAKLREKNA